MGGPALLVVSSAGFASEGIAVVFVVVVVAVVVGGLPEDNVRS